MKEFLLLHAAETTTVFMVIIYYAIIFVGWMAIILALLACASELAKKIMMHINGYGALIDFIWENRNKRWWSGVNK